MTTNPIIQHKFTSDPTATVFDGRIYVYTGHDEAPRFFPGYVLTEWLCFSSPDLGNWTEHSINLRPTDFSWAMRDAFAANIVQKDGKFYFFVSLTHANSEFGEAIGVAVSDSPTGPFIDAKGSAIITNKNLKGSARCFDPSVLVDDDGNAYLFWGKNKCHYARLKPNMCEIDGAIQTIELPEFQEGAHIYKRNQWYYLSYGYQFPEKVAYAMARSINGPWDFKGILNEVPGNCETNRPAIIGFKGEYYFFYHNGCLPDGGSHRRSVCVDKLHFNPDGTVKRVVMTSEGPSSF